MPGKCVVADATKVLSLKNKTTPIPHLYSVEVEVYCYLTFEGQHYVKSSGLHRADNITVQQGFFKSRILDFSLLWLGVILESSSISIQKH